MSQRNGKDEHAWIRMNETTRDGCKMNGRDVNSAASDIADDKTTDDQVLNEASNNANTPMNARGESISPEATSKPIICQCRCTRNLSTGLRNDKETMKLREYINSTSTAYHLARSPDTPVLLPGNFLLGSSQHSFGRSPELWNMPRTLPFELPQSLDDFTYRSEEDSTSDDGCSEYGLQFDANESADQGPSDDEPDLQDMPDATDSDMENRQN